MQIDPGGDDQVGALAYEAERGAAGVRLYTDDNGAPQQPALWKAAGELGVAVSAQGTFEGFLTDGYRELIASVPDTQVVIEHFGNAGHGQADRQVDAGQPGGLAGGGCFSAEFHLLICLPANMIGYAGQ